MIEEKVRKFRETYEERYGVDILNYCCNNNVYHLGIVIGKYLETIFPRSKNILREYASCLFLGKKYVDAYDIYNRILSLPLNETDSIQFIYRLHLCITNDISILDRYNVFSPFSKQVSSKHPLVTVTITTCKRLDLFKQTMDTFLNCCLDIEKVDKWLCVDDNSSENDRNEMKKLYPFFEFIFKTDKERGHPKSMNIIKDRVTTPYIFHLEDDWKFFCARNYISECIEILNCNNKYGQCLINRNYAEVIEDIKIVGGIYHQTHTGIRYYVHEYDENRKCSNFNCLYWPHFSFRPSMIKTRVLREVGDFLNVKHFEKEYAHRYVNKGYSSVFLEGIYTKHIGKLTSDKTTLNAYDLNNQIQFEEINYKVYIINLERRSDRLCKFIETNSKELAFLGSMKRFIAVDGMKLRSTNQLQRIFDGNDYNMRRGMVGCALSHIQLYINLLESNHDFYIIFEDDITVTLNFEEKLKTVFSSIRMIDWDIVYLGHTIRKQFVTEHTYDTHSLPIIEKWDKDTSLKRSMGGTGGYMISKKGAEKLLEFINTKGMTNCIDTMQQKSADILNVFYCLPHLIYSECSDSDIQMHYDSLTAVDRLKDELEFYNTNNIPVMEIQDYTDIINDLTRMYYSYSINNHPTYTIHTPEQVYIYVTHPTDFISQNRYFDRLKKKDKYSIDDVFVFKC
jgi:GR25 family glycosyltransferase involved in LPS biosynthesis